PLSVPRALTGASGLDLHVHASREVELHERIQRLLGGLENVEEALVGADLELLAALLVHVRRAQHRELVDPGGQRDGPRHARSGATSGLNDLARTLVQELRVVRLQPDADLLCRHANPRLRPSSGADVVPWFSESRY